MGACSVGPNYKRPAVNAPGILSRRFPAGQPASAPVPASSGPYWPPAPQALRRWVTRNGGKSSRIKQLQELIRIALKNNYDVRIAAARVLQAQAQLGITEPINSLPSIVGGNVTGNRNPQIGPIPGYQLTQGEVSASAAWNLDFWGRYRRATEAARPIFCERMVAEGSGLHTCCQRGELLFCIAAAGLPIGNIEAHVELSPGFLGLDQDPQKAWD